MVGLRTSQFLFSIPQMKNFRFILYRQFSLYSEKRLKSKKGKGRDPELRKIAPYEKSQKMLHPLRKANMRAFYTKQKIALYVSLICGKHIIITLVQRDMLSGHLAFTNPLFRNHRCLL